MDPARIVTDLLAVGPRGSCTDAERRAARLLSRALKESGRRPRIETVWVRPQWSWLWLLHATLGIAGSVASVDAPVTGLVIVAVAAVSAIATLTGRLTLLGLLWPRRATQNVVSRDTREAPVRLVIAAPYDAPRAMTGALRTATRLDGGVRRALGGRWPHPLATLTLALLMITGCAIARVAGVEENWLGAVQLLPTVVCIVAVALLADPAFGRTTPGASAHASTAAAALSIAATLDRRPPRDLDVDVVLAGASDGPSLGMRAHVAKHRRDLRPEQVAVLHLEPCGGGSPHVWTHDGPMLALPLHPRLVALSEGLAPTHRGHGTGGAYRARQVRWPAIAVGCLDERGRPPGKRLQADTEADVAAIRRTVDVALQLVARLDADLGGTAAQGTPPRARRFPRIQVPGRSS